ncbi:BrnT family toxin [Mesorhizobium sp. BH1-1-4]|uniref:BrnT family toxin n=1 Tax=Mesorhizobium sp. BH1-1-4 TaxID=2876662 RepID=UPI001CD12F36|nr:BrnT family toxin [Mesorhizobium sp. BH1-1-4]MBZ9992543.1 BrnT family toxin [Mesorhizobium sp. BH1-1-4]
MLFEWDETKARTNRAKDFGEDRLVAIGLIEAGVYVMVYVERGDAVRVISLRRATRQEIMDYVENL